ncbi:MAG: NADPH-dependent F420 reductase [Bryobacteraceae bacterium]|nr:NADPH-dependent F420 reductase [Bryobacteraceae bacterium]
MNEMIAIVGGTGAEGGGLAMRFAKAGARVAIGSREAEKAREAAQRIAAATGGEVDGRANADAVGEADIVVLTVPLAAQAAILKSIRDSFRPGAILVDATVPLEAAIGGRVSRTVALWDGSAAQQAARLAPAGVRVVAAFHALSAHELADLDAPVDCDVLICGDDAEAKAAVRGLVESIAGARAVDAGPLDNARLLESVAALLIALNLRHKVKGSGIRITGLPEGTAR